MPLLTNYRPNFCSQCGSKIVRLRWLPWHSRRFCRPCGSLYRKERFLEPTFRIVGIAILAFLIGRSLRPKPPPLIIQRQESQSPASVPAGTTAPTQTLMVEEQIYICGARTKKGTPCSRRVHGPVRCWQHKGLKAMLPDEKLRVKD